MRPDYEHIFWGASTCLGFRHPFSESEVHPRGDAALLPGPRHLAAGEILEGRLPEKQTVKTRVDEYRFNAIFIPDFDYDSAGATKPWC